MSPEAKEETMEPSGSGEEEVEDLWPAQTLRLQAFGYSRVKPQGIPEGYHEGFSRVSALGPV